MKGVKFVLGRLKGEDALTLQTVIFDESEWDSDDAAAWLKDHDLSAAKVDETDDSFRFRQRDPGDFEPGSFRTVEPDEDAKMAAVVEQLGDGERYRLTGVTIFRAGKWNGDTYTERDLDEIVGAFNQVGFRPPLKLGHGDELDAPAYGWVDAVRRVGATLVADLVDLPKRVFEAIRDRRYDSLSAEIFWNVTRNGQKFKRALKAVALLGAQTPAVDLPPLREHFADDFTGLAQRGEAVHAYAFRQEELMTTKKPDSKAELTALTASLAALTSKVAVLQEAGDGADGAAVAKLQADLRTATDAVTALTVKVNDAAAGDALGVAKLQEQVTAMATELAASRDRERAAVIARKVDGFHLPVLREHFRALYTLALDPAVTVKTVKMTVGTGTAAKAADVTPEKLLDDLVERLEKFSSRLFTELGTAGDLKRDDQPRDEDPGLEVDRLARTYMADKKEPDYGKALSAVLADPANAEVKRAYALPGRR